MSGYTGSSYELLYSYAGAATTTTPTAAAVSLIATYPPVVIPGGYMSKLGSESSALRVVMHGQATATATVPTWIYGLAITTTNTFGVTSTLAQTAAFTPSVVTGAYWVVEAGIALRAVGQTNNSTVVTIGEISAPNLIAAPGVQTFPASNVAATFATWQVDQQYYLWPFLTLSAATAGNTMTTQMMKVYGEN